LASLGPVRHRWHFIRRECLWNREADVRQPVGHGYKRQLVLADFLVIRADQVSWLLKNRQLKRLPSAWMHRARLDPTRPKAPAADNEHLVVAQAVNSAAYPLILW